MMRRKTVERLIRRAVAETRRIQTWLMQQTKGLLAPPTSIHALDCLGANRQYIA
jgi:hypothetical protein